MTPIRPSATTEPTSTPMTKTRRRMKCSPRRQIVGILCWRCVCGARPCLAPSGDGTLSHLVVGESASSSFGGLSSGRSKKISREGSGADAIAQLPGLEPWYSLQVCESVTKLFKNPLKMSPNFPQFSQNSVDYRNHSSCAPLQTQTCRKF